MLEAFEDGGRMYQFPCVTGDSTHPTNVGTFTVLRKRHPCRSNTYDVDMNYALFFTNDGKAIHQYHGSAGLTVVRAARQNVSDWFGSHGCVRLEEANAKTLYNWTPVGTRVVVF
jgi:lipoprotein-anchoring transpeptidase ErfK/SrfK